MMSTYHGTIKLYTNVHLYTFRTVLLHLHPCCSFAFPGKSFPIRLQRSLNLCTKLCERLCRREYCNRFVFVSTEVSTEITNSKVRTMNIIKLIKGNALRKEPNFVHQSSFYGMKPRSKLLRLHTLRTNLHTFMNLILSSNTHFNSATCEFSALE